MAISDKSIEYIKGQKLLLTLSDNRMLEGVFAQGNKRRSAIILHKVTYVPSNGKSCEQLEIKLNDISKIHCIQDNIVEKQNIDQSQLSSDLGAKIKETENPSEKINEIEEPFYKMIKQRVSNHVFIDQIDDIFVKAVMNIKNLRTVAVAGEGSSHGRFGQLTVLGLASRETVYVFDLVNLGQRAFKSSNFALKKILESNQVLKVVHNCRFLSDCLKHRYQITLKNVFDTQACHIIVVKNQSGHPPTSAGFSELVSDYLQLPSAISGSKVSDPDSWCRRPLEEGLAETIGWKVALLLELKPRMEDAFYAPLDRLCQFYLTSVRDLDDEFDVRSLLSCGEEGIPKEVTSGKVVDKS